MTREAVLMVHVALGALGLSCGPLAVLAAGRLSAIAGRAYCAGVAGVAATACLLATYAWGELWWLVLVAVATQGSLLLGLEARRRRDPGWEAVCAHALGGTYVALVTGLLIASVGAPVLWVVPAILAQWPIAVAKRRLSAQGVGSSAGPVPRSSTSGGA